MRVIASVHLCANGETSARKSVAIPCQAIEDFGSMEGVETRGPSSNGNAPHERPTPRIGEGEDIVRHSGETRRAGPNSLRNSCYSAIKMYTPAKNIIVKNAGRAPGST